MAQKEIMRVVVVLEQAYMVLILPFFQLQLHLAAAVVELMISTEQEL